MHDFITISIQVPCDGVYCLSLFSSKQCLIIRFGSCDILNNQGLGNCYQPRPSARLLTLTLTLIIPDITKTTSNNCLLAALGVASHAGVFRGACLSSVPTNYEQDKIPTCSKQNYSAISCTCLHPSSANEQL